MRKLKTKRSARKRFITTPSGCFSRKKAFKSHFLEKKSSRRKRGLSQVCIVSSKDFFALRKMLPY